MKIEKATLKKEEKFFWELNICDCFICSDVKEFLTSENKVVFIKLGNLYEQECVGHTRVNTMSNLGDFYNFSDNLIVTPVNVLLTIEV